MNEQNLTIMIILGIFLMIVGGVIFAAGEQNSCLFLLIGAVINFIGFGILVSAF